MDRAERLIREANPASDPLSERAEASLARILAVTPDVTTPLRRQRAPRLRWVVSIAAAVALMLVITVAGILRPPPAVAASPPMLTLAPVQIGVRSALQDLSALAASRPDASGRSQIITQWWAVASEVGEGGTVESSHVQPVRRVSTFGPGGVTVQVDYAGQPFDINGEPTDDPDLPAPGTELGRVDVLADELFFPSEPPSDPTEFGHYLAAAFQQSSVVPATDAMERIAVLLAERILTPSQNAALASYVASLPDVELLGATSDRLGRQAVVFAAPLDPESSTQMLLLFGVESGCVVATETVYRGTTRSDIPSPAVVEYIAWEHP